MKQLIGLFAFSLILVGCESADPPEPDPPAPPEPRVEEGVAEQELAETTAVEPDEPCKITLGWDPWEPYHFSGIGGRVQGLDIDIVSAIAERVDCDIEFLQGSWAGLLRMIRTGELDLLLGATRTDEREEFAWFSDPYREESFALYVRTAEADQWSDQSLQELLQADFRLGVTQGYIYGSEVTDLQENPEYADKFIEAAVGELNFTHLMDHRIDGFLEDPFVFASIDRRRSWDVDMESLPVDLGTGDVHMMFSRESVDESLVQRFDEALAALRADSEYEEIMARYLDE